VFTTAAALINAGNYYTVTLNSGHLLTPYGAVNVENNLALNNGLINTSTANSLTLYQNATVTGGSNASFVNGRLSRETPVLAAPTAFVFPIGKGTAYRPLTLNITSQTTTNTYTAEQKEGNPGQAPFLASNGLGTAPLVRVSSIRSYELSSINSSGSASGTVTLSFGTDDGVNNPSDAGLAIAARNSLLPAWANIGNTGSTGASTGPGGLNVAGTLTSAVISNLANAATLALGATNENTTFGQAINPLPVQLTSFTAQRQHDRTVTLKWATATEKNSAYFEVQRSLRGGEFTSVARVTAQGNSSKATQYAINDRTAPSSTLYYRLRQTDMDGKVHYSPITTVGEAGAVAKVVLYPNPTQSTIGFIAEAATPYRVLNQLGQVLLRGITQAGTAQISVESLTHGLYLLELQTEAGRVVQKFEKQ
jgi:hypothetical protein